MSPSIQNILKKAESGERLSFEEGVALFRSDDIFAVGRVANAVRERLNGNRAYYVVNMHINYSNVCVLTCTFCAFKRRPGEEGAYTMSLEEVLNRTGRIERSRIREIHMVGGLHPKLPFDYYCEVLSSLKSRYPHVQLKAFTAVEMDHFCRISKLSIRGVLTRLREAGLDSMPGGGAEMFSDRVRRLVCPEKMTAGRWLEVVRAAHEMGIHSNATMLYGHVETVEERVDHLVRLRELQDETKGFLAFIPLAFHPENTGQDHLPGPTGFEDLKTLAVSRLMLDNFPHIKAYWIIFGPKLSQVALSFGVDDIDGTVIEERIYHEAGATTPQTLTVEELRHLIEEAGREPVERDALYHPAAELSIA